MKVKELLTDESKWCQGAYAKDAEGKPVLIEVDGKKNPEAVRFCLIGAVYHCYGVSSKESFDIICKMQAQLMKNTNQQEDSVGYFNDSHKWDEVKSFLDKFDI